MKRKKNNILKYFIGEIELTKGQVSQCLKDALKEENEACKIISFLATRKLFYKLADNQIDKLFKSIESPRNARWVLRFELPNERQRLVSLVASDLKQSIELISENLHISEDEFEIIFSTILKDPSAIISVINSIQKIGIVFPYRTTLSKYKQYILEKLDEEQKKIDNDEILFVGKEDKKKFEDILQSCFLFIKNL